jgi:hypothetical protein
MPRLLWWPWIIRVVEFGLYLAVGEVLEASICATHHTTMYTTKHRKTQDGGVRIERRKM